MLGAEAGNYKGVMLCNRPTEPASYGAGPPHITPAQDAPSFRPVGLPAEPLGLNPAKENLVSNVHAVHDEAARRRAEQGPRNGPNFMSKHRAWLGEMAKKKAALNAELQASAQAAEEKRSRFVAYTRSLRDAVRERAAEMDEEGLEHAQPDLFKGLTRPAFAPPQSAAPPTPPHAAPVAAPRAAKAASKPAWAMTEEEADDAEDMEAAELVKFAQGLDFDSYVDDLEVRQALDVIRERIDAQKAVEAAAAAADLADEEIEAAGGDWRSKFVAEWNGDDAASQGGASRRAPIAAGGGSASGGGGEGERPDWDASTSMGDGARGALMGGSARAMAEELLRDNPELAAKHSVKSLASVVSRGGAASAGTKKLGCEGEELPPLRVVTIIENPRVASKEVDPSNLPYLHRNPAV